MRWTIKIPKAEGYYWVKEADSMLDDKWTEGFVLHLDHKGNWTLPACQDDAQQFEEGPARRFAGPIEYPKE